MRLGIGDDAAVLDVHGRLVLTTDTLIEGVDFFADAPLRLIGHKALAANLSDLAAMGAVPTSFLLTIAVPPDRLGSLQPLLDGMAALARRSGTSLIGGDLSRSPVLTLSITALGRPTVIEPLVRSSARTGDRIFVSRPLGGSEAGLHLYRNGWRLRDDSEPVAPEGASITFAIRDLAGALLRHHLAPEPETELGAALGAIDKIHACIDVSDGLSTDLHHICRASGVAALVEWERIPIFPDLTAASRVLGINIEQAVLHGGEEYALLFTSPLGEYELSHLLGRPVFAIGRMREGEGVRLLREGHEVPLGNYGFDHFAER